MQKKNLKVNSIKIFPKIECIYSTIGKKDYIKFNKQKTVTSFDFLGLIADKILIGYLPSF